jgi:RimJ/RimL family protein N-acetyltransferase
MLSMQVGPALVRDLEPWHADELAGFFQRSGGDLYEWLPWEHFESAERTTKFLTSLAEGRAADKGRIYGLWLGGVLVGGTMFPNISADAGIAELGVFLAKEARGQGIVTLTVEAMIDWAFVERGFRRLEWRCTPTNEPSRAIPRRLGFTLEGIQRQAFKVREDYHDLEMWSLLRDEWRA